MAEKKHPSLIAAGISFSVYILYSIFCAVPVLSAAGIFGLYIPELILLLGAVIPIIILKYDFKEIFPICRPRLSQLAGVFIVWLGALIAADLLNTVALNIFPQYKTYNFGSALSLISNDYPREFSFLPVFAAVTLTAAVCEEVYFRGYVQKSLGRVKNKWLVAVIVGTLFGIAHLDLFRFLSITTFGIVLSYVMSETNNIILPLLVHLINNTVSFIIQNTLTLSVGISHFNETALKNHRSLFQTLLLSVFSPWLIYAGSRLLKTNAERLAKKPPKRTYMLLALISMVLFIGAVIMFLFSAYEFQQIYHHS